MTDLVGELTFENRLKPAVGAGARVRDARRILGDQAGFLPEGPAKHFAKLLRHGRGRRFRRVRHLGEIVSERQDARPFVGRQDFEKLPNRLSKRARFAKRVRGGPRVAIALLRQILVQTDGEIEFNLLGERFVVLGAE